jgi:hypothetical protein
MYTYSDRFLQDIPATHLRFRKLAWMMVQDLKILRIRDEKNFRRNRVNSELTT